MIILTNLAMLLFNIYDADHFRMIFDLAIALSVSVTFTYITCNFIRDSLKEYFEICRDIQDIRIELEPKDLLIGR